MLAAGSTSLLTLLSARMFYMQVVKSDEYRLMSDQNRINLVMLSPLRGDIIDCHGRTLAGNRSSFKVMLDVNASRDYKASLQRLFDILDMNEDEQERIMTRIKRASLRIPLAIIEDVSWKQLAEIEENIIDMDGIYIEVGQLRTYPYGADLSHVIGYNGILNEQEKRELGLNNIGNFNVGKSGIEKFYETNLRGNFGIKKMEVNAHGGYIREISKQASIKGEDLALNIDAELQVKISGMLPASGGSVVVIDLQNGKVISMVSGPGFDPNEFTGGVSHKYWKQMQEDQYKPLLNKVTQGLYPPGSVFKMFTVLAALEAGIDPTMKVHCAGGASALGGKHFRCWYKPGHGNVDMRAGLDHSCNAYMYHIAKTIGGEKILELARRCGLGVKAGIDMPIESSGFVPDAKWKKRRFKTDWTLADSLNIAIGQGSLLVTPLQLANLIAIIASGGKIFTPRLAGAGEAREIDIDPKHMEFLRDAMWHTVNSAGSTAYSSRVTIPGWEMAGKTGTAQVQDKKDDEDLSSSAVRWASRNHGLFVGYAPAHNPRYAISVIVDHGGGGAGAAAPIARDVVMELSRIYA